MYTSNAPSTTELYTLSLHDALPISRQVVITISTAKDRRPTKRRFMRQGHGTSYAWNADRNRRRRESRFVVVALQLCAGDRKSTRLNSSHLGISYAVFCLKNKKKK